MRQIVLDTETTGLEVAQGHRIIEIGCVELVNRRPTGNNFHRYLNPGREIDPGAVAVHGITNERLANEPGFSELARNLWDYLSGAELIIHNAPFDLGFLDHEFADAGFASRLSEACTITDTVVMARKLHPGQKASLDALCKRYNVDNSNREFHGALLDARLLADVYLAMTGGQSALLLDAGSSTLAGDRTFSWAQRLACAGQPLRVIEPSEVELGAHLERLKAIAKKGKLIWVQDLPAAAS